MEQTRIGPGGLSVSRLGVGCWAFGGGSYWGAQHQNDVERVVHMALDSGVNYFDTAECYNNGASELSLGEALQGRRVEAVVGTKLSTCNIAPGVIREHCEQSLRRLRTDYIDVYMLHWPINAASIRHFDPASPLAETPPSVSEVMAELEQLRREGKIRWIGISNHGVRQMEEIERAGYTIAVNELPYNLISRAIETEILPYCIRRGIGVFGYMAYQQGILTGKFSDLAEIPPSRAHSRHFRAERGGELSRHGESGAEEEISALLAGMKRISRETGLSLAELSMAWAIAPERGIACTLVGNRNEAELRDNLAAAERRLTPDVMDSLNRLSRPVWERLGDSPDYYENRKDSRIA